MPTIDPAEFDGAGTLGRTVQIQQDAGLAPPGSAAWVEQQMHEEPETEEDRQQRAVRKAHQRIAENARRMHEEAELHKQEMARGAAQKQAELDTFMGLLEPEEGRRVRMEAYCRAMDAAHGNQGERQMHADMLCLRIARYMVEGKAE